MLKENELIGAFTMSRQEVRPFTDKQIALATNFAAQAVIAIENARLLNELRQRTDDLTERTADLSEALEQQTATSEVLQVISSSTGDLQPVFATMLEKAVRICQANFGLLTLYEAGAFPVVAMHNVPEALATIRRRDPIIHPGERHPLRRVAAMKRVLQIADVKADTAYLEDPQHVRFSDLTGARTLVVVPMLRESDLVGTFSIYRQEVRLFSDKQIELVKNFTAQAVIAIENARLLNDLRQRTDDLTQRTTGLTEALEQQTATSDVLKVISGSPGDLQPVFDTMLANATRLCEATHGHVWSFDGEQLHAVAVRGDAQFVKWLREHNPVRPIAGSAAERIVLGEPFVHVADRRDEPAYRDNQTFRELVDKSGIRASLSVALRKGETLLGMINVYRQEVRPFTDKQIELVKNFAAQAVIAIENARLLNELRQRTDDLTERTADLTEALEQQTATSEVLQVISSSPGDLPPIFATMLEKAVNICDATFGDVFNWDGGAISLVASHNTPSAFAELLRHSTGPFSEMGRRMIAAKSPIHIADLSTDQDYVERRSSRIVAAVELGGTRTVLAVPMLKSNELIGAFILNRKEVRPFTEKQIALVQGFAAQAVIAIENARLLNELRHRTTDLSEALEQQTATSDVLQVISSSPGDLKPVFDKMLENAVRICDAKFGDVYRWEGDVLRLLATHKTPPAFVEELRRF